MTRIELNIPTNLEVLKDVIERHGGKVETPDFFTHITKQPEKLNPIYGIELKITGSGLFIDIPSQLLSISGAEELQKQLKIATTIVNEYYGMIEAFATIKKRNEERNKKIEALANQP